MDEITRVASSNDSSHLMAEVVTTRRVARSGHPNFAFLNGGKRSKICTTHDLLFMNAASHSMDLMSIVYQCHFEGRYWLGKLKTFVKTS